MVKPTKAQLALLQKISGLIKYAPEGAEWTTARNLDRNGWVRKLRGDINGYGQYVITDEGRRILEENSRQDSKGGV